MFKYNSEEETPEDENTERAPEKEEGEEPTE